MWADWMGEVVAADLKQLAEAGLQVLRVFLMWPDFQPIEMLYAGEGSLAKVRHGEQPLPSDEIGQAGLSAQALEHFGQLAARQA